MVRLNAKTLVSAAIIAATFLFFASYVKVHFSDFRSIAGIGLSNFGFVVLMIVLSIITIYTNGLLLDITTGTFGVRLGFGESFSLAVITNFYNFIAPFRGGLGARAFYLKQKHKFSYTDFLAALSAVYVIIFFVTSIAGLASMFFVRQRKGVFSLVIFYLFLGMLLFLLSVIIFSPKIREGKSKWLNRFIRVINGWHIIKSDKKAVMATSVIAFIQLILGAVGTIATYRVIGVNIDFFAALFLTCINFISLVVSITPSNVGIGDAISIFSAKLIGVTMINAVAVSVLVRVVGLITIGLLGPVFCYFLFKNNQQPK